MIRGLQLAEGQLPRRLAEHVRGSRRGITIPTQRNVKNWSSGEMGLRWTAAGMLEAEKQFRKVIGYTDLPRLAIATERRLHLHQPNSAPTQEAALAVTM